jgi:hypothetical protein
MNLRIIGGLIAGAILLSCLTYFWGYHKAWDAGRQELVEQQRKQAQARLTKQLERQHQDDTRAAAAETAGAAKTVTITQEVVKYLKTPGRNVCTFDEARVKLKQAAVDNANNIPGYDHE